MHGVAGVCPEVIVVVFIIDPMSHEYELTLVVDSTRYNNNNNNNNNSNNNNYKLCIIIIIIFSLLELMVIMTLF
jgi:hypothetical protein